RGRVHQGRGRARAARGHVLDGAHTLARPGRDADLDIELVHDGGGRRQVGGSDPALRRRGERGRRTEMTGTATETGTLRLKTGPAEMLKGGVIMDVTDAAQARIAEEGGAVAVMALERVPADIRREGGVARMADPAIIESIMAAVSIPVMAKCRIGHFAEARV